MRCAKPKAAAAMIPTAITATSQTHQRWYHFFVGRTGGFGAPPVRPTKKWYQRWWVWLVAVIAVGIIAAAAFGFAHRNQFALESKIKDLAKKESINLSNLRCPSSINTGKGHTY